MKSSGYVCDEHLANNHRSLNLGTFDPKGSEGIEMTRRLLDRLVNLSQINIYPNVALVGIIYCYPIPTVTLDNDSDLEPSGFVDQVSSSDISLSKVILDWAHTRNDKQLDACLAHGIQVRRLSTGFSDRTEASLGTRNFQGLCELTLDGYHGPFFDYHDLIDLSLSWLSKFTSRHPLLKKISFSDISNLPLPFISSFIETASRKELGIAEFTVKSFAVTRIASGPASEPFGEWYISGMHLSISEWLAGQVLHLAHSFFPNMSILTMDCDIAFPFVCCLIIFSLSHERTD